MSVDWRMGVMPDIGMNAMAAFQQGRQVKEQRDAKEAMAAYAVNPNESGLNALAQYDPKFVVETKRTQATTAKADQSAELTRRVDLIGQVAQWADSPEKWDAGVEYLASLYPDLAQYKGKFTPEARMSAISAAGEMKAHLERQKPVNMAPGNQLVDPNTGNIIAKADFAPRALTLSPGQTAVEYRPGGGTSFKGGFDAFHSGFLAAAEGGFNPKDPMSGAPVNFGIDQKANPDIDVRNLTPDQARQLMHDRYWVPSGADQIENPALQAVHADTAINMGVGAAKGLLEKSGGDPAKYLQLREQRYREIGGPALGGWLNRNRKLAQFTGLAGGGSGTVIGRGDPKPPTAAEAKANAAKEPPAYSQSAMDAFDRAIGTATRLLSHPGFNAAVGVPSINPLDGNLAGYVVPGSKAADFRAELDALKAQVFLPMVQSMKGMGALSNAEGQKLTDAIGALDPKMSEDAFRASLNRVIGDLNTYKSRATAPAAQAPQQRQQGNRPAPASTGWGELKVRP